MERIALQLWTVRDRFDADPETTLRRVAELGYPAIELVYGRDCGLSHHRQMEICRESGLDVAAMHCFFDEIDGDLDGIVHAAQEFEVGHVVCAWMDPRHRESGSSYRAAAEKLGAAGERLRREGLQLAYHHHDFELAQVDGRRGIDYLWDLDHDLLKAEVDTYWVHVAGLDVVAYVEELGDRLALLHCKDHMRPGEPALSEPGEGLARFNREVGEGVIDFPPILRASSHAEWLITEQDFTTGNPLVAAAVSLDNLRRMLRSAAVS